MVAPNLAIKSQGTLLYYSDGGSPSLFTLAGGIRGIADLGGGAMPINNVSTLDSDAVEKLPGLADEGSVSVSLNANPANAVQVALRNARRSQTRLEFKVVFSNASTAVFFGYVTVFSVSAQAGGAVGGSMTIEVDGAIAWS